MDAKIRQLLDLVREYVKSIVDPLLDRLETVENRQPEKGEPGRSITMVEFLAWAQPQLDEWKTEAETRASAAIAKAATDLPKPKDGQSVTMEQVSDLLKGLFDAWAREADGRIVLAVKSAVSEIPKPKDGDPGKDAIPVDVEVIKAQLVEYCDGLAADGQISLEKMLARAVESLPKPKDGEPGKDATPVDVEAIKAVFAEQYNEITARADKAIPAMVAQAVAAIPKPKDGDVGKSVTIDDVMPLYKAWFAEWALGAERSFYEKADRAIAAMPKPKDGRDGVGVKDIELVRGRVLRFTLPDGGVKEMVTALPLYRGVFKEGTEYELNDLVTYGGHMWIGLKADGLKSKPDAQDNDSWRLCVKKGSDGRDAR